MSSPVPPHSEVKCVLPHQVLALGEALAPVGKAARQVLACRVRSSGEDFAQLESLSHHMGVIERALSRLEPRLEGLMHDVIQKEGAEPLEIGRSVGRLEQVISELTDGYLDAKASRAGPESTEARTLILGVYRHHIRNICAWVDDLVATIANPVAALRRRGMQPSGEVVLTVPLNMTTPPEMAKLRALVRALQSQQAEYVESRISAQQTRDETPGVLGTIGALAFGLGLSQAALGRRHG